MRQALNNLEATFSGFQFANQANVFRVCHQPYPPLAQQIIKHCIAGTTGDAYTRLIQLYDLGYSATDIITTLFIVKNYEMEFLKLEFIWEVDFAHMHIADVVVTIYICRCRCQVSWPSFAELEKDARHSVLYYLSGTFERFYIRCCISVMKAIFASI